MRLLWRLETTFGAVCGVVEENGVITQAAPMMKWMIGRNREECFSNYSHKLKGRIFWVKEATSDEFSWKPLKESFCLMASYWDIDRAKELIQETPRPVSHLFLDDELRKLLRLIYTKKNTPVELLHPVICGVIEDSDSKKPCLVPIDGWHRIAWGFDQGFTCLPMVSLTREESMLVSNT